MKNTEDDTNLYESLGDYFRDAYEEAYNEDNPDDESKYVVIEKELFEIYLEICIQLSESERLNKALPTSKTFHVMAKCSRQYNHWEYMYRLLPAQSVKQNEEKLKFFLTKVEMSVEEECKVDLIMRCVRFFGRNEILFNEYR